MTQLVVFLLLYVPLVIVVGHYLFRISMQYTMRVDRLFNPIEQFIYRITGVSGEKMTGKHYILALISTNACMVLISYLFLRLQKWLFLNPHHVENMEPTLAFNTVISFMTNTNLQHYAGESGLSYFTQMIVITFMMFTSAATGYAACMAFCRRLVTSDVEDNFFVDMTRMTVRVLVPFAFLIGLLLVAQGVPQTLKGTQTITTIEGTTQQIALGPVASLESIKHLGTNGGGFFAANSSTPFENPTIISNMIEMLSMMLLPGACVIVFGLMVAKRYGQKKWIGRQGIVIFTAMAVLFIASLTLIYIAEKAGTPLTESWSATNPGNMEGKETRFGIPQSALFTAITTAFTTGTVNNMHDSLTPLGGLGALFNMMLNVVFGGKGVGLMNMMMYVLLTIFVACLMIGRTPQFLGKKIEATEMKLLALVILIHPAIILVFTALASAVPAGYNAVTNPGAHGFSQMLYEFTSASANNGSGFEGLVDNTPFWNITTAFAMFFGRYATMILQLALAFKLAKKMSYNESVGTLQTDTPTFTFFLIIIVLLIGALTFLPALALGPISEQLQLFK